MNKDLPQRPSTGKVSKAHKRQKNNSEYVDLNQARTEKEELADLEENGDMNSALQERQAMLKQMEQQIIRLCQVSTAATNNTSSDDDLEQLLIGYISSSHSAALQLMDSDAGRAAGAILRGCEDFVRNGVPERGAKIVTKKGLLHTVLNNLAQHSNMMADMDQSIEYLEAALVCVDSPETDPESLPLAETYLNLANGYSYVNKFQLALKHAERALGFSTRRCTSIRNQIVALRGGGAEDSENGSSEVEQNSEILQNLEYQLNDFLAIKIMSFLAVGEQQEKLGNFVGAAKFFSEGKSFAETNFGTKHPLYIKCVNAIGGAKLKSKYQTREVYQGTSATASSSANIEKVTTKASTDRISKQALPPIASKRPPRESKVSPSKKKSSSINNNLSERKAKRSLVKDAVKNAEIRYANQRFKTGKDSLLLSNCDNWSGQYQCNHKHANKANQASQRTINAGGRKPSTLSQMVRTRRQRPQSGKERRLSRDVLESMSDKKTPFKVMCRNGPGCGNHDWNERSPIKKVCTRGQDCRNHDWDSSSVNLAQSRSSKKIEVHTVENQSANTTGNNFMNDSSGNMDNQSQNNNSCLLAQSEKIYQQQMAQMRSMQEDQFKMIQLVLEAQRSQNSSQTQQQPQQTVLPPMQQPPYMPPPQMFYPPPMYMIPTPGAQIPPQATGGMLYPQWASNSGLNFYPQQQNNQQMQMQQQSQQSYGSSIGSESDEKEPRQENNNSKKQQDMMMTTDDQVKIVQASPSPVQKHQKSLGDIKDKDIVIESKSEQKMPTQRSSVRQAGGSPFNQQQTTIQEVDDPLMVSDLNDRVYDVSNSYKLAETRKSSIKKKAELEDDLQRASRRSVTTYDDVKMIRTSADNGTDRFKSVTRRSKDGESSGHGGGSQSPTTRNFKEKSYREQRSVKSVKSIKSEHSLKTEKSFRMQITDPGLSKQEAALVIQKNYRRYICQQDYQMAKKAGQKQILFKATIQWPEQSQGSTQLTCTLKSKKGSLRAVIISYTIRGRFRGSYQLDLRRLQRSRDEPFEQSFENIQSLKRCLQGILDNSDLEYAQFDESLRDAFENQETMEEIQKSLFNADQFLSDEQNMIDLDDMEAATGMEVIQTFNEANQISQVSGNRNLRRVNIEQKLERIKRECGTDLLEVDRVKVKHHAGRFSTETPDFEDDVPANQRRYLENQMNPIRISQAEIRGSRRVRNRTGSQSSEYESDHSYKFKVGGGRSNVNPLGMNKKRIVKIQALVRGFLARLQQKYQSELLFYHILEVQSCLVRVKLVKNRPFSYTLSGHVLKSRENFKVNLTNLPFEEDQTADLLEDFLICRLHFEQLAQSFRIQELRLKEASLPDHIFIMDYSSAGRAGKHLIKEFRVHKETYNCHFYEVIQTTGGNSSYQVEVFVGKSSDHITINRLPVDMKFMAYYLQQMVKVYLQEDNCTLDFVTLGGVCDMPIFREKMKKLEQMYLRAAQKAQLPSTTEFAPTKSNSVAAVRLRVSSVESRDGGGFGTPRESQGILRTFEIDQNDFVYQVQIHDQTQTKARYLILVTRVDNSNDKDYVYMPQVMNGVTNLENYIRRHLKIYIDDSNPDKKISYLALQNNQEMFSRKNRKIAAQRRQITESNLLNMSMVSSQEAGDSSALERSSMNDSSYRRRQPAKRTQKILSSQFKSFTHTSGQNDYEVRVSKRMDSVERPIQVTVINKRDESDQDFITIRDFSAVNPSGVTDNESEADQIENLKKSIKIYTKKDQNKGSEKIDYIAVAQDPQTAIYRKNVAKMRARQLKKSQTGSARGATTTTTMVRMSTVLGEDIDEFEIEREGIKYEVRLQHRVNDVKDPLQVTVINLQNSDDSDFIKINPRNLRDQDLINMLQDRLQVYTKIVDGEQLIDYVALLQSSVRTQSSSVYSGPASHQQQSDEPQWNRVASSQNSQIQQVVVLLERAKKVNLRMARLQGGQTTAEMKSSLTEAIYQIQVWDAALKEQKGALFLTPAESYQLITEFGHVEKGRRGIITAVELQNKRIQRMLSVQQMINGCSYELYSQNWTFLINKVQCVENQVIFDMSCENVGQACDTCEDVNVRFPALNNQQKEDILAEINELDGKKEDGLESDASSVVAAPAGSKFIIKTRKEIEEERNRKRRDSTSSSVASQSLFSGREQSKSGFARTPTGQFLQVKVNFDPQSQVKYSLSLYDRQTRKEACQKLKVPLGVIRSITDQDADMDVEIILENLRDFIIQRLKIVNDFRQIFNESPKKSDQIKEIPSQQRMRKVESSDSNSNNLLDGKQLALESDSQSDAPQKHQKLIIQRKSDKKRPRQLERQSSSSSSCKKSSETSNSERATEKPLTQTAIARSKQGAFYQIRFIFNFSQHRHSVDFLNTRTKEFLLFRLGESLTKKIGKAYEDTDKESAVDKIRLHIVDKIKTCEIIDQSTVENLFDNFEAEF